MIPPAVQRTAPVRHAGGHFFVCLLPCALLVGEAHHFHERENEPLVGRLLAEGQKNAVFVVLEAAKPAGLPRAGNRVADRALDGVGRFVVLFRDARINVPCNRERRTRRKQILGYGVTQVEIPCDMRRPIL